MVSRPLLVASVAALLLVVVLSVDAAYDRTVVLEIESDADWHALATGPTARHAYDAYGAAPVDLDPNGTATLRLRIENEYPWTYERAYSVMVNGVRVADGTFTVAGSTTDHVEFTVPAKTLFDATGYTPKVDDERGIVTAWVSVTVGSRSFGGSLTLKEAPE